MNSEYYDALETRDPGDRLREQTRDLIQHLKHAFQNSTFVREQLDSVDINAIESIHDLKHIPVVRKSELTEIQSSKPIFGGLNASTEHPVTNVFASPGPIFEFLTTRSDFWRIARAMHASGFRSDMLVHNSFSYHFTPAGAMFESGSRAIGCHVFPAGVGQTDLQVDVISRLKPQAYAGTPSFLKILLERANESEKDISSIGCGLVSGEALPPSLRHVFVDHQINILQCYATADVGLIAYESNAQEGLIIDEGIVVEIVRPGTGDPVAEGEVGEVVVTPLNPDYPLVRFGTGDLSAFMEGQSSCGRTNRRIKGWMGRADQTTKVRGMFVHPSQVAQVVSRIDEVIKARMVVSSVEHQDVLHIHCETASADERLKIAIVDCVRDVCKVRASVVLESPGSLPNDGIVIKDDRTYE